MKQQTPPDNQGNFFVVEDSNGWRTLSLKLTSDTRTRELGRINLTDRYFEIKRSKAKHLFRKTNSYGFNEHVIRNATTFDSIRFTDEDGTYVFPRDLVLKKGGYLHFKAHGFEKQLFLPVNEMKPFKVSVLF